jgi:uncharacterized protein (TIGR03083 family)
MTDIRQAIAEERRELAAVLGGLPAARWDAPTLCAGWRVREVVAHMTMPFRYSLPRFMLELAKTRGNFNRMADQCGRTIRTTHGSHQAAGSRGPCPTT